MSDKTGFAIAVAVGSVSSFSRASWRYEGPSMALDTVIDAWGLGPGAVAGPRVRLKKPFTNRPSSPMGAKNNGQRAGLVVTRLDRIYVDTVGDVSQRWYGSTQLAQSLGCSYE